MKNIKEIAKNIKIHINKKIGPLKARIYNSISIPGVLVFIFVLAMFALGVVDAYTSALAPFILLGSIIIAFPGPILDHFSKWYKSIWIMAMIDDLLKQKVNPTDNHLCYSITENLVSKSKDKSYIPMFFCKMEKELKDFNPPITNIDFVLLLKNSGGINEHSVPAKWRQALFPEWAHFFSLSRCGICTEKVWLGIWRFGLCWSGVYWVESN